MFLVFSLFAMSYMMGFPNNNLASLVGKFSTPTTMGPGIDLWELLPTVTVLGLLLGGILFFSATGFLTGFGAVFLIPLGILFVFLINWWVMPDFSSLSLGTVPDLLITGTFNLLTIMAIVTFIRGDS